MRNKNYTFNVYRLLIVCTLLFGAVHNNSYAQNFSIDASQSSDPADSKPDNDDDNRVYQYVAGETLIKAVLENFVGLDNGDPLYLYYNKSNDASDLNKEQIINTQNFDTNWSSRSLNGLINTVGEYSVFAGHFLGRFDNLSELNYTDDINDLVGGEKFEGYVLGSATSTYTSGHIPTSYNSVNCDPKAQLIVTIPEGAEVTSVDVSYSMTATNGAYMSEQYSKISCITTGGLSESSYSSGTGNSTGTYSYTRSLDIANGVTAGGSIVFEMDAYRTWDSNSDTGGCGTSFNKVDNGTWTITVNYREAVVDFPISFTKSGNRYLTTNAFALNAEIEGDVNLVVDFDLQNSQTYPLVVEYSTNGGSSFTALEYNNGTEDVSEIFPTSNFPDAFELPAAALKSATLFRVRQVDASALTPNSNSFTINSMSIVKGEAIQAIYTQKLGDFEIVSEHVNTDPVPSVKSISAVNNSVKYPGEEVEFQMEIENIDDFNGLSLFVKGPLSAYQKVVPSSTDLANDQLNFKYVLPSNIEMYYGQGMTIDAMLVEGDEIVEGSNGYDNIITYTEMFFDAENLMGSNSIAGNDIDFTLSGTRQYTTLPIEITNASNAILSATITRLNEAVPTTGSDIVIEYTTNGTTWLQLGDNIALGGDDGVGLSGKSFEFSLDESIVSEITQFRARQITDNNREDINTWQLRNFHLFISGRGGNIIENPVSAAVSIASPTMTVELKDNSNELIYSGDEVTFTIKDVDSDFVLPDYAYIEVTYTSYDDNSNVVDNRFLQTLDELKDGDFDVKIPFDNGGFKNLFVSVVADGFSNKASAPFTVQSPSVEITSVSNDLVDNDTEFNVAGKNIEVAFKLDGNVGSDIAYLSLEYFDGSEWMSIAQQELTSGTTGTIAGELPVAYFGDVSSIRVALLPKECEDSFTCYSYEDQTSHFRDDEYRWYDFSSALPGSKYLTDVTVITEIETESFDNVYQYSSDWEVISTNPIVSSNVYQSSVINFNDYIAVPEDLLGTSGKLGITYDADVNLRKLRVITPYQGKVISAAEEINVAYPTVSLSDINEFYGSQFYSAQEMEFQYSTFAIEEGDAKFAIYLEQGSEYIMLDINSSVGLVNRIVTMPTSAALTEAGFDLNSKFDVQIVAFDPADEEAIISDIDKTFVTSDFTGYGYTINSDGYDFYFSKEGQRSIVIVEKLENLADYNETVTLSFDYYASIQYPTESTLPKVQISSDNGETYTSIEIPESEYASLACLDASGTHSYEVEIPVEYLSEGNYIRFIQDVVAGADINTWRVSNVHLSGINNLLDYVLRLPGEREINYFENDEYASYINFDAYQMSVTSFDYDNENSFLPEVHEGETITLDWKPVYDEEGELVQGIEWPANTMFEFMLPCNNDDGYHTVTVDAATQEFDFTLADSVDVTTGLYNIKVKATIVDEEGEVLYQYPSEGASYSHVNIFTREWADMQLLFTNETTPTLLRLNAEQLTSTDFYLADTAVVKYELHGEWTEDIQMAGVLELFDASDDLIERQVLEIADELIGDSIAVKIPNSVEEANRYELKLYPYIGDAIEFGTTINIENDELIVEGGIDNSYWYMNAEGNRSVTTPSYDLFGKNNMTLSFVYATNSITENPATLPRLEVSIDGENFTFLEISEDQSQFGNLGYLPESENWRTFTVDVPEEYLSSATQFRIAQETSFDADEEVWAVYNFKYTYGTYNIVEPSINVNDDAEEEFRSQEVNILQPLVSDYTFELVRDEDGFEPVLFPTDEAQFTFTTEAVNYPEGTEFSFYIEDYIEEPFMIASAADTVFTFTLPNDIERGTYDVYVHVANGEYVYEELLDEDGDLRSYAGSINVYNPVLKTVVNEEEVIYAGNTVSVSGVYENSDRTPNADYYYNLVLTDQIGDQWLLATKQGNAEFNNVVIPTFVGGANRTFEIVVSMNSAVGVVGEKYESIDDKVLNSSDDFEESRINLPNYSEGTRVTLTTTTELDLTDKAFVKFDIAATELAVTDNQKVVLEYSIDGGYTYVAMASYPDERFDEENMSQEERIAIPSEANIEGALLRWRIEEFKESFNLSNIALEYMSTDYTYAPVISQSVSEFVSSQKINIEDVVYTPGCEGGVLDLTYSIKGKFGADAELKLKSTNGSYYEDLEGEDIVWTSITEGSGIITLHLNTVDYFSESENQTFEFDVKDETASELYEESDYEVSISGESSRMTASLYKVAEINNVTLSADNRNCVEADRIATISGVQEHFIYQLRNYVTGELVGDAVVVDTEDEDLMDKETFPYYNGSSLDINLGLLTEELTVEVQVTSQANDHSFTCVTEIPNEQAKFYINPIPAIHYTDGTNSVKQPITEAQLFEVCEGTYPYTFYFGYYKDGAWNSVSTKWLRNGTTVATSSYYNDYSTNGNYTIEYDLNENCSLLEPVTFAIEIYEVPEQPTVTMPEEEFTCETETVTLTATEGYTFYRWYKDGSQQYTYNQTLEVNESGVYQVEVSNVAFDKECVSAISTPVAIDLHTFNDISLSATYISLCGDDNVGELTMYNTQAEVTYLLKDEVSNEVFATVVGTGSTVTFTTEAFEKDMQQLYVEAVWDNDENCTKIFEELLVTVEFTPEYVMFVNHETVNSYTEVTEDMQVCYGASLKVSTADEQSNGTNITWHKDGYTYSSSYYINEVPEGIYKARFSNGNCEYDIATVTVLPKVEKPMLTADGESQFCEGEGEYTLIAPEDFAGYIWYRNSTSMTDYPSDVNTLSLTNGGGSYYVKVKNEAGCVSPMSDAVSVEIYSKPSVPEASQICDPEMVKVSVSSVTTNAIYSIINYETGETLSNSYVATSSSSFTMQLSSEISGRVTAAIVAQKVGEEACSVESLPFEVSPSMIEIVAYGNVLEVETTISGSYSYVWFRNGNRMNNQSGSSITIYDDAQYSVIATPNSSDGCKLEATFGELATTEPDTEIEASIYPNPATNFVNLKLANYEGDVNVKIYDVSGTLFGSYTYEADASSDKQIDLSNVSKGYFNLEVTAGDKTIVERFIKN
ncbi:T9SS type A sorting domain-containing protein [Saccharicrinis aurantiacus]|uniref:T9SS type A sorting domain-containing protein n=1 Tax=Saccharicrinis aurantiacus TaxID=1849719 RepID=UPI000838E100|nr:T9SS type A sorting domain-containing protein [Saccharicrinis aurantiacus]